MDDLDRRHLEIVKNIDPGCGAQLIQDMLLPAMRKAVLVATETERQRCADIVDAWDSRRGNEAEISQVIRGVALTPDQWSCRHCGAQDWHVCWGKNKTLTREQDWKFWSGGTGWPTDDISKKVEVELCNATTMVARMCDLNWERTPYNNSGDIVRWRYTTKPFVLSGRRPPFNRHPMGEPITMYKPLTLDYRDEPLTIRKLEEAYVPSPRNPLGQPRWLADLIDNLCGPMGRR